MKKIVFYLAAYVAATAILAAGSMEELMDSCEKKLDMQACYKAAIVYQNDGDVVAAKSLLEISCAGGISKACDALKSPKKEAQVSTHHTKQYDGKVDGKLQSDIDHDGKLETIAWRKTSSAELGDYYQLVVIDDTGAVLWEGPRKADDTDPLIFFSLDTGVSLPQIMADFDLDGNVELLAPMAQSDVSPTCYRKLRWRGDHFEPLLQSALMFDIDSDNRFVWRQVTGAGGTWVSKLSRTKEGEVAAEITSMRDYGGVDMGELVIVFDKKGATVKRVLRPPAKVGGDTATSPFSGSASEAEATPPPPSRNPDAYRARISRRDHYNSRGTRLRKMKDILRQERANYYKHGGDKEDQRDRYFSSLKNRRIMGRMHIEPVGISYAALDNVIRYGTPLLEITVSGSALKIRLLKR